MPEPCVIKFISHPYAPELWQARKDHAHITKQPLVERPFWYEDIRDDDFYRGYLYHDLYACIGWPSEVKENDIGMPGYAAIVGVVKPKELGKDDHCDTQDAKFLLLDEVQSPHVPLLLDECVKMRERYGFGIQPNLLTVWLGDPERFMTTLALYNERLTRGKGDHNAILITPPDDFYSPSIFDNYVRSIRTCLVPGKIRFYFGKCDILKERLRNFHRDDPAVLAAGGLIHTMLSRCMWMDNVKSNVFKVEETI